MEEEKRRPELDRGSKDRGVRKGSRVLGREEVRVGGGEETET